MKHLIGFLFIALFAHGTPCGQVAQALTDYDRQEFIQKNMLADKNAGFESGISQWSGTPALVKATGGNILFGKGSATWDSTSASQTMSSASGTMPNGLLGQNCEASILIAVPSGTATHNIQAFVGTDIISVPIVSSVTPRRQVVTFPCPVAATTIRIRIQSVAANEPLIAFDDAYIGVATNVGTGSVDTPTTSYVPTGSWVANSTYTGKWWRRGDRLHFRVRVGLTGAPTASSLTFSYLPAGLTIDTSQILGSLTNGSVPLAKCNMQAAGSGGYEGTGYWNGVGSLAPVVVSTTGTYGTIANITQAVPATFASGDSVECTSIDGVPILGWTASTVVTANQQRVPTVTNYLSGSGTHTWSNGVTYATIEIIGGGGGGGGAGTSSTAGGAGGQSSFDGVNAPGGTGGGNATGGGSGTPGAATAIPCTTNGTFMCRGGARGAAGTVTDGGAGALHSPGGHGGQSRYGGAGLGLYESAGSAAQANTGSGGAGGAGDAATFYAGAGGTAGADITWHRVAPSGSASYSVGAAGAAGTGTRNGGDGGAGYIKVTEHFGYTTAILANSVSTEVMNGEKIIRVGVDTVCNSSPCTLARNSGFTNVTRSGTGNYTATFATPFSSPPECFGNGGSAVATFLLFSSPSTNSVGFQSFAGAVITDNGFRIWCVGPR